MRSSSWLLLAAAITAACGSDDGTKDQDSGTTDSETEDGGDMDTADSETEVILPVVTYDADDERIQYTGRIDFTDPKAPAFSTGGTYIKIRFTGVALRVLMDFDNMYGAQRPYMDVLVDGERQIVAPSPDAEGIYEVATGLSNTEHEVLVARRSQSDRRKVIFRGFEIGGELLDPPARPERRIQIVGDSIAAGEGSDVASATECSGDWNADQQFTNGRLTFGPMLANILEADYQLIAWSGKGLFQNYDINDDVAMPALYERMFMELTDSPPWDHDLFVPDAILIELGTNDFGASNSGDRTIDDITSFVEPYIAFVDTLLGYYPDVEIFILSSHLLDPTLNEDLEASLVLVEANYADQGIDQVHTINVAKVPAHGCNGHPNADQHETMAAELEPSVREIMGW